MGQPTVCFITPPSAFLLDERVFVSLGILKVAAALEARGYPVEVLDLSGVTNYDEAAETHARNSDARIFALTATTPQMPSAKRVADAVRRGKDNVRLILGGPHPTLAAAAAKREATPGRAHRALQQLRDMFDVVVAGDGEDAIEQAVRAVAPEGLVIDADDPKGPLFLTRKRLEEVPPPARHLVDMDSYHYTIEGVRATTMIAQLGCPFACTFCGGRASPMLRRARMRSTESVIAEMENLYTTYGYKGFMLYDDELNVSKSMVELMRAIAKLQAKHGVAGQFRLRGFVKAELLTQEQAHAMYDAGFRQLLCGFESGSPRILENIQKKATVEDNDRAVAFARAAGLKVKALMSIGHAGESAETIEETKQWILRTKPNDFDCTIITPYPGSPYYDEAVLTHWASGEEHVRIAYNAPGSTPVWTYTSPLTGDRLHAFELDYMKTADYYKGSPDGGYRSYVFTDHLSPEDLVRLRDALERDVRAALDIPFNPGAPGIQFEASMGQLPAHILRRSAA